MQCPEMQEGGGLPQVLLHIVCWLRIHTGRGGGLGSCEAQTAAVGDSINIAVTLGCHSPM